jgi:hypothetical protein
MLADFVAFKKIAKCLNVLRHYNPSFQYGLVPKVGISYTNPCSVMSSSPDVQHIPWFNMSKLSIHPTYPDVRVFHTSKLSICPS